MKEFTKTTSLGATLLALLALLALQGCGGGDAAVIAEIEERLHRLEHLQYRITDQASNIEELNLSLEAAETALSNEEGSLEKSKAKLSEAVEVVENHRAKIAGIEAHLKEEEAKRAIEREELAKLLKDHSDNLTVTEHSRPVVEALRDALAPPGRSSNPDLAGLGASNGFRCQTGP